jgi:dimethylhistidine N-methyltransferase
MFSGVRLARDVSPYSTRNDGSDEFARDVITGLSAAQKSISPKYFYDAEGSQLFEAICTLPEYYPTRAETALLTEIAPQLAEWVADDAALVEFGAGACDKVRLLLDAVPQIALYVPIDICSNALESASARLRQRYPALRIAPLVDDFTRALHLPAETQGHPRVGFFPGSTLGNFTRPQAVRFLRSARELLGPDARFIIGVDMVKDAPTLEAAYDDAAGVTARFNKNLLTRINRELNANFNVEAFDHLAVWNAERERMEMHLVSQVEQVVKVAGHSFHFAAGERLHTENSHKFTVASFTELAGRAGWSVSQVWISDAPEMALFSLQA